MSEALAICQVLGQVLPNNFALAPNESNWQFSYIFSAFLLVQLLLAFFLFFLPISLFLFYIFWCNYCDKLPNLLSSVPTSLSSSHLISLENVAPNSSERENLSLVLHCLSSSSYLLLLAANRKLLHFDGFRVTNWICNTTNRATCHSQKPTHIHVADIQLNICKCLC